MENQEEETVTIHIQDVTQAYPGLKFDGLIDYAGRGVACRGRCAVVPSVDPGLHEYYRAVGIGVDQLMEVPFHDTHGVYPALLEEPYRSQLLQMVSEGHRLQFFNTRAGKEEKLVQALGLSWDDHVVSWPSGLADKANDKAALRELGEELWARWVFPEYRLVNGANYNAIRTAIMELGGYGEAMVKLNDSATSQGHLVPRDDAELWKWFQKFRERIKVVLVDQFIPDHVSITTAARVVNGVIEDRWFSQQDMSHKEGEFEHKHTLVGDCDAITEPDELRMLRMLTPFDNYFLQEYPGASGIANYDFIKGSNGRVYMVEGNFRMGQSTFNQEIRAQVAKPIGCPQDAVTTLWGKVWPTRATNFNELQRDLGDRLWDGQDESGVIPMATGCLAHGYCHMVAIGSSEQEARDAFQAAEQAL